MKEKNILFIMSNFLFWMENMEINLLDNISPDWRRGEGSTLILLIVPKVAHVQMLSEDAFVISSNTFRFPSFSPH